MRAAILNPLFTESPRPAAVRAHRNAPWFAVLTVCFGAFMGQLDASIVTVAFPAIQRGFHTDLAAVQWVSLAYLLALVALLVPAGKLSDMSGRKLIYLYGFLLFTAASAGCGFAGSLSVLVVMRVVQAAGAAMLQANSVALVVTSVRPELSRAALGVQAGAQALGLAAGPTLGGVLVTTLGWRAVFFVNVPVGILAVIAGWFLLPRTRHRASRVPMDLAGTVLLATAAIALLLGLSVISGLGLPAVTTIGLLVLAAAAVVGLVRWERRAPAPLLDARLLRAPGMAAGLTGAFFAYVVLFGPLVLLPQTLGATGAGSSRIGLVLTALPAGFAVAAVGAERLLKGSIGSRARGIAGAVLATLAAAALAVPFGSTVVTVTALAVLGLGLGLYIPGNNATIMAAVPRAASATAGGMVNMTRGIGTALGVAGVTLALHLSGHATPGGTSPVAMGFLAACALVLVITGLVGHWNEPGRPGNGNLPASGDAATDDPADLASHAALGELAVPAPAPDVRPRPDRRRVAAWPSRPRVEGVPC